MRLLKWNVFTQDRATLSTEPGQWLVEEWVWTALWRRGPLVTPTLRAGNLAVVVRALDAASPAVGGAAMLVHRTAMEAWAKDLARASELPRSLPERLG